MNLEEIKEWKEYLVVERNGQRIKEQKLDLEFFEDTFHIPYVKMKETENKNDYEIRTGFVAEMANGFTQQLIAAVPKVLTNPKMKGAVVTKSMEEAADRVASTANKWCYQLGRQTHNPFKQTFKSLAFTSGESWIYIPHNPYLAKYEGQWQDEYPEAIPVHFILYPSMVVFHDPSEDVGGKPTRVLVYYRRTAADLRANYKWKGGDRAGKDPVSFMFYADLKELKAWADDDEELFSRRNIYGCLPFSHSYTGWGVETADMRPELLAYSRTRMIRGRVEEDTAMASDFRYNIHATAWRHRTVINKSGQELGDDFTKEYHPNDPGKLSVLTIPPGVDVAVEETQVFEAPVFAYRAQVRADLNAAYPAPLKGQASGTSGRQEDILAGMGLSMYDCVVENNSTLWSEAFKIAIKIGYKLPGMIPFGLQSNDNESFSELKVETRRDDPLDSLRRAKDGDLKYQSGIISLETNLINYQGMTKEEAKKEMARLLVDDVTRNHPVFREIMGMQLAREMGMEEEFGALSAQMQPGGANPPSQIGSQGGPPRQGNIKTETGREQADLTREPTRAGAL